ncbi:MAG TPA: PAS domain-containing protein [Hyphomicrobiaceae bacterium]|jgi:PAS domain-containing protein|nr:PAS domain-containing protein [Hyphomicrobiaceae bacterium]
MTTPLVGKRQTCIAATIVWTTIHEFGRYGDPTRAIADRVLAAHVAIFGTALAALALAAVFAERRRHETALSEIDARLRSSLDAANIVVWDVDLIRDSVHSAGPVRRMLHRPTGPVPRGFAQMLETIHPEDRDRVMAQFWAAARTDSTFRVEFRLNSDILGWVTAVGSIERDADGVPERMRGITHDITERKTAELALAERATRSFTLPEKAPASAASRSTLVGEGYRPHPATVSYTACPGEPKNSPARDGEVACIPMIYRGSTPSAASLSLSGAAS